MSSGTQIDYDALAAQHGGTAAPAVDYDALAAQHGGTAVQSPDQPKGLKDQLADFGRNLWQQINPVAGLKGLAQATSHPINALNADANARTPIVDKAYQTFQQAHQEEQKGNYGKAADLYSGGAAHWLYGHIPFLGETLDKAGTDFQQGNYGAGAGASTGLGINLAAPAAVKNLNIKLPGPVADLMGDKAKEIYQSSLKPPPGSNSTTKVARMVDTGIQNQIPVSAKGVEKISGLIDDLNQKISAEINSAPNRPINPSQAVQNLNDVRQKFASQVNPQDDLAEINKSQDQFLDQFRNQPGGAVRNMTAAEAQAMKQGTYRVLGGKAYGEMKGATIEAQKALARGLKEELDNAFPELSNLNSQEGALLDLQPVLERAVRRIDNHQLLGIGTPLAAAGAKAVTSSAPAAAAIGAMKLVLDNPIVKSKLAFALAKASKGSLSFPGAMGRVQAYTNALGEAGRAALNPTPEMLPQMAQDQNQAR